MNILLLGKDGQVGFELQRSLSLIGNLKSCNRLEVNLLDIESITSVISKFQPDIIVNAAAYTAVDKAEEDFITAYKINSDAVSLIAHEAKKNNSWLIHYSTDYVYDGKKSDPYLETDKTSPLNKYGLTKLDGEEAVRSSGCKHMIFRTSWVYSLTGKNFIKTILSLAREKDELSIVSDQIGAPTSAELIADVTMLCLRDIISDVDNSDKFSGLYHLSALGEVSWYEIAKFILEEISVNGIKTQLLLDKLLPINSNQFKSAAVRPKNSRLNTDKLKNTFNIYLPNWKYSVKRLINEIIKCGYYGS